MMLCGEQYSFQPAATPLQSPDVIVASESHQATAPRLPLLMQLA
jgi:hypothetical protein|tara:strand:- start:647 stop:778 length:132 start_codon:yes stop_codon:yes gene_type:complete